MIRGVLLDVGDTMTRPRGGRWNPRSDFEGTLAAFGHEDAGDRFPAAVAAGDRYLDRTGAQGTRDDYHRVVLGVLGIEPTAELLAALDAPLPFGRIIEVFPDVDPALSTMKDQGLGLAIVSDTRADARRMYEEFGWSRFFDAYVISDEVGCCKPDSRMYRTASELLGLEPDECLFVDNDVDCLLGAVRLGHPVCGISRYGPPPDDGLPWATDLDGVLALLADPTGEGPPRASV